MHPPLKVDIGLVTASCSLLTAWVQMRRKPKIAKGARDLLPDQMRIRDVAFGKIKAAFARHGAVRCKRQSRQSSDSTD